MKSIFIILLLTGCASVGIVPLSEQNFARKLLPPIPAKQGQVCFVRDGGFVGSGLSPDIIMEEEKIGVLSSGTSFCNNLVPGTYTFTADSSMDYDRSVQVVLGDGKRIYVDYTISVGFMSGNGDLHIVRESVGLSKIYSNFEDSKIEEERKSHDRKNSR